VANLSVGGGKFGKMDLYDDDDSDDDDDDDDDNNNNNNNNNNTQITNRKSGMVKNRFKLIKIWYLN
jgi:hypothetical protein